MMNDIIRADELIQQGVDEFKMAAAKTATGIIEQGLAVLKIKQGCEVKQGGTDFPETAMRELGLSKDMAKKYAVIGDKAEKLVHRRALLPMDSISTIYMIACMDDATIDDKIERGIITPTATRDQVLEQVRVRQPERTRKLKDDDYRDPVGTVEEIILKLKPAQQRKVMDEVNEAVKQAKKEGAQKGREQIKQVQEERVTIDKTRAQLSQARQMVQDPFTRDEYKLILGMLHPDKHPGLEERAQKAFDTFKRIETICKKVSLKVVS